MEVKRSPLVARGTLNSSCSISTCAAWMGGRFSPRTARWMNPDRLLSSRRRHTRLQGDWSSDVCSSDLKSALSVTFMHQVASSFQAVVFRSVRDASPCLELLADCLHMLSPEVLPTLPPSVDRRIEIGRASCRERV